MAIGKSYSDTYFIDFSQQSGTSQLGEPPLYNIAKNVEQIQKDINNLLTGYKKLNAIVYTKREIERKKNKDGNNSKPNKEVKARYKLQFQNETYSRSI